MANLHDCLQRAIDGGELDATRGRAAQSEFDQLVARYSQAMPIHQAEATAARDLKEATRRGARSRRHMVLNQLQAMVRLKHLMETAPDPGAALRQIMEWSPGTGAGTGESVQALAEALAGSVNAELNDFLKRVGPNKIGNSRDKEMLADVIDELHLSDTGNATAKNLADAIRAQQQRLRQMFNALGGDIGDLADFGMHHSHDAMRIRKVGFRAWADSIKDKLAWDRIEDHRTGKPFAQIGNAPPDDIADRFLEDVYNGIVTRGWDDREPAMTLGGKALYNRHAEHRVLHFKTGRDAMAYNAEFGTSDPFSAIMNGLHGLAHDIALMRVLGPNPKMGLEYATQVAKKRAAISRDPKLEARVGKQGDLAATMLAHFSGAANQTEWAATSAFFSNTRKVLTSIQLGSATLSAVTDMATVSVASKVVGMNPANVISRHVQLMASHASRETAARMGYVAETLAQSGAAAARWTGDVMGSQVAERLSGFTMRASGLSYWTDMIKTAWRMEFAGFLADNADRAFADIDAPLRDILQARGITAADWEELRNPQALFRTDSGKTFLAPHYWRGRTGLPAAEADGLALRLQMIMDEQLELAVPSASLEGRARILGETDPGQAGGILLRSTLMYKNFALSLTLNQYRRFVALPTPMAKAQYAAGISTGLLVLGALAVQLKELAKGRDPRPMDEGKFWMAALLQGGGVGIFGDFFAAETSRAGGGFGETVAGPVAGFAGDLMRPVASNITRAIDGKDPLIGRDLANLQRYDTPVLSSLWYSRAAYDRLVSDNLQRFLDPEAEQQWHRQQKKLARDYGTAEWWQRGQPLPNRAPNLLNALGEQQ